MLFPRIAAIRREDAEPWYRRWDSAGEAERGREPSAFFEEGCGSHRMPVGAERQSPIAPLMRVF